MKEKRKVYIVEYNDEFKVFDTLAEVKASMLHEYLNRLEQLEQHDLAEELEWLIRDLRSIDNDACVEELFYSYPAEYCGG